MATNISTFMLLLLFLVLTHAGYFTRLVQAKFNKTVIHIHIGEGNRRLSAHRGGVIPRTGWPWESGSVTGRYDKGKGSNRNRWGHQLSWGINEVDRNRGGRGNTENINSGRLVGSINGIASLLRIDGTNLGSGMTRGGTKIVSGEIGDSDTSHPWTGSVGGDGFSAGMRGGGVKLGGINSLRTTNSITSNARTGFVDGDGTSLGAEMRGGGIKFGGINGGQMAGSVTSNAETDIGGGSAGFSFGKRGGSSLGGITGLGAGNSDTSNSVEIPGVGRNIGKNGFPKGQQFSLKFGNGRCIYPKDGRVAPGTKLVLPNESCFSDIAKFFISEAGNLKHAETHFCIQPENELLDYDSAIVIDEACDKRWTFNMTSSGSLKLVVTGQCIQTSSASTQPSVTESLVLRENCNEPKSMFQIEDPKPYLGDIGNDCAGMSRSGADVGNGELRGGCSRGFPNGLEFSLQFVNGRCLYPENNQASLGAKLVAAVDICRTDLSKYTISNTGNLRHVKTGFCVQPEEDDVDVPLILGKGCDRKWAFSMTVNGSLQVEEGGKCVQSATGSTRPSDAENFVLRHACDLQESQFTIFTDASTGVSGFIGSGGVMGVGSFGGHGNVWGGSEDVSNSGGAATVRGGSFGGGASGSDISGAIGVGGMANDECQLGEKALGMEDGRIQDTQITSSSAWSGLLPQKGRLNSATSWSAGHNDLNQWIQIDLRRQEIITRIATQGRKNYDQWVTSYMVSYSFDGERFENYKDSDGTDQVAANPAWKTP